jgi:hypothetical protein
MERISRDRTYKEPAGLSPWTYVLTLIDEHICILAEFGYKA